MKRLLMMAAMVLMVTAAATAPALALEHEVEAPDGGMFAPATSVEQVTVVGGGPTEADNIDRSKNAAVVPPPFGSPESYQDGTGEVLTPQPTASAGGSTSGSSGGLYYPPADTAGSGSSSVTVTLSTEFTLPDGLFYSDGSLGRMKIPALGLSVKVYEDESLESLAKGAGHFKSTSCWDGNVGLAGHNRGVADHFGQIHTLDYGDRITYTTKLGTRTYEVFYVGKIDETDFSRLDRTSENIITLITCVRNDRDMRWCVQAREVT